MLHCLKFPESLHLRIPTVKEASLQLKITKHEYGFKIKQ